LSFSDFTSSAVRGHLLIVPPPEPRGAVFEEKTERRSTTKQNIPSGSSSEEQPSQKGLLRENLPVGQGFASGRHSLNHHKAPAGNAPVSAPSPQQSLAIAPVVVFKLVARSKSRRRREETPTSFSGAINESYYLGLLQEQEFSNGLLVVYFTYSLQCIWGRSEMPYLTGQPFRSAILVLLRVQQDMLLNPDRNRDIPASVLSENSAL